MEVQSNTREYQKAIEYICNLIASGELQTGSRLPTERRLAETLSIGRNSTREALRMLENMGLIESRRGSGNYLTGDMSGTLAGLIDMMLLLRKTSQEEICSFRRNMEKAVCYAIIEGGHAGTCCDRLEEILLQYSAKTDRQMQARLDKEFHYTLIHATENQFWIFMMEAVAEVYRRWIDMALQSADADTKDKLHKAHKRLVAALKAKDSRLCGKAIDRHYNLIEDIMGDKKENDDGEGGCEDEIQADNI